MSFFSPFLKKNTSQSLKVFSKLSVYCLRSIEGTYRQREFVLANLILRVEPQKVERDVADCSLWPCSFRELLDWLCSNKSLK